MSIYDGKPPFEKGYQDGYYGKPLGGQHFTAEDFAKYKNGYDLGRKDITAKQRSAA